MERLELFLKQSIHHNGRKIAAEKPGGPLSRSLAHVIRIPKDVSS